MPPPTHQPLITRRPLKCDGPPPQWVSKALETAQQVKVLTLAIPVVAPATTPFSPSSSLRLLLGRKKRGFGEGYFNGFGGKLEPGESTDQAAVRELCEESGLTATALEHVGVLTFVFDDQCERPWQVHVYAVPSWRGSPEETDEMAPIWFDAPGELPFGRMWADDRYWYPRFVEAVLAARAGVAGEETSGGGDTDSSCFAATSAPCFEGVFGFRSTHEMAWAGLWALQRPGEPRSAVADEAAREGQEDEDAGSGPRDGAVVDASASSCPWLPLAPAGGAALVPESLAHLQRAAELARATATVNGGKPTAWKGFVGDGQAGDAAAAVATGAAVAV
jgi:8-oxo-dGTP pyrophosphatase MutT (NUDIX family)